MSKHSNTNMEECGLKATSEDIDILTNTQRLLSSYQFVMNLYRISDKNEFLLTLLYVVLIFSL